MAVRAFQEQEVAACGVFTVLFPQLGFFSSHTPTNCPKSGFWRKTAPPEDTVVTVVDPSWLLALYFGGPRADVPPRHRGRGEPSQRQREEAVCHRVVSGFLWLGFGDRISWLLCTSGKERELTEGKQTRAFKDTFIYGQAFMHASYRTLHKI